MYIYITRHGQTQWNLIEKIQGHQNSSLTEKGRQDAKALGEKLKEIKFDKVFSSDLDRALETARLIVGEDFPIETRKEIREIALGIWEGMTYKEIETSYPQDHYKYMNNPSNYKANNGGEDYYQLEKRVKGLFEEIKNLPYENILVVTHGVTYLMIMNYLEGKDIENLKDRSVPVGTSLTKVSLENNKFTIIYEANKEHIK